MSEFGINVNGKPHSAVVLIVTKADENGRPRECRLLYPEESVDMRDGLEFVTCFVPTAAIDKGN
jgi:hypothetical protein